VNTHTPFFKLTLKSKILYYFIYLLLLCGCKKDSAVDSRVFSLVSYSFDSHPQKASYYDVTLHPQISFQFSHAVDRQSVEQGIILATSTGNLPLQYSFLNHDSTVVAQPISDLKYWTSYSVGITPELTSSNQKKIQSYTTFKIVTLVNPAPKLPLISDDELLTKVQQQTFKYFYDFAHPASGMARERNSSGSTITTGGTGFGIMALIEGMERGFITRRQGLDHITKIISFLETADRFHGAWGHWMNGNTGKIIPFSANDNGGDLVETSFLVQGLIAFRQYMNTNNPAEKTIIDRINVLWESVEWDWYRKDNSNVLYWHWSPDKAWIMNFALSGYFEEQITYILAAASPTHSIPKSVYENGFCRNGAIVSPSTHYGFTIPTAGLFPLFWVHYSYLGMNPHFKDDYINYWEQGVNASLANHAYCSANPKGFGGYSDECWGLTASDNPTGYSAQSPGNDNGTITPTAALSSFPYTPTESMKALKFFYYTMGDRLWGDYGFYDAFSISKGWQANSTLAIDQGPIVVMIENYRTGKIWDLFMSAPEVEVAMTKLNLVKTN